MSKLPFCGPATSKALNDNTFCVSGIAVFVEKLKCKKKNLNTVKACIEIPEITLLTSPGDNAVLTQKFPDVFCCVQKQPDVPHI